MIIIIICIGYYLQFLRTSTLTLTFTFIIAVAIVDTTGHISIIWTIANT